MTNPPATRRTSTKRTAATPHPAEPTSAGASPLAYLGASGGHGGAPFLLTAEPEARLLGVEVRHAGLIDAVGLIWSLEGTAMSNDAASAPELAGGSGGETSRLMLDPGETLTRISGRCGQHIDALTLTTSRGRAVTFGGDGGESEFRYDLPPGTELAGLFGRAGRYLDALGILVRPVPADAGQPTKAPAAPRKRKTAVDASAPAVVVQPEASAAVTRTPRRKAAASDTDAPKATVKRPRKPKADQD
ncbi:jacalin-like lectin [Deinococcus sonorensis]|uniref:Jacalin-like lectin n=2 Tax=Deinococcus sonorensis TaxID=309891 RepID=A0AAU7U7J1_9DEIO